MNNHHNNTRYYIQGDNIIQEYTRRSVCANAQINQILFDEKLNEISSKSKIRTIKGLSNPYNGLFYFDNSSVITKASCVNKLSFKSTGKITPDNQWYPTFISSKENINNPLYTWSLSSLNGKFLIIENYSITDSENILQGYKLVTAKILYIEQDSASEGMGIVHTFAPPFPNLYEDGKVCLGSFTSTLDLNNPFKVSEDLLSSGWNSDLYRARRYTEPDENLTLKSVLRNPAHTSSGHGFIRTTQATDALIASCVMYPQLVNV